MFGQSICWPQLLVAFPHDLPAHVVFTGSATHVQTAGVPEQMFPVGHAVHRAVSLHPFCASVGTHFWLQFLVPAGQLPMTHVVPEQVSAPPLRVARSTSRYSPLGEIGFGLGWVEPVFLRGIGGVGGPGFGPAADGLEPSARNSKLRATM